MKIVIASDIHGSALYCGKLLEAYKREKADKLVLLGDILYHGPRNALPSEYDPPKVAQMLNDMAEEILCVRGNCDCEVDQMVLNFPVLADYGIIFHKNHVIYITHGHIFNKDNLPKMHSGDIILAGHTHVPACEQAGEYMYINPGSVSIPKEGSDHSYMTLDDDGFKWFDLDSNCYKKWNV